MPLFNLFKKPFKLQDEVFGAMRFTRFKDASKNFFECEAFFQPLQREIGLTIDADETGATKAQKEWYALIQGKYDTIKTAITPLLYERLFDWYEGETIEDIDKEFDLESIGLTRIGGEPVRWSMIYVVKRIDHWATIEFVDLEPRSVLIDG
ncbi:hypothetical protein [Puia sp.]|jgi:hypothetical protein|uniref:hypothetical protein n=1 Tax=Puia sp. TaxID=2045100 RepID=UPI002F42BEC2